MSAGGGTAKPVGSVPSAGRVIGAAMAPPRTTRKTEELVNARNSIIETVFPAGSSDLDALRRSRTDQPLSKIRFLASALTIREPRPAPAPARIAMVNAH
jgi:hypothetical protein